MSDGGLIGCDNACIHADNLPAPCIMWPHPGPANCTKRWHHNWVSGCREKCVRGDDATVNLTIDHSVVYNCGMPLRDSLCGGAAAGVVLKGDYNRYYQNTVFNSSWRPGRGELRVFTSLGPPPPSCGRPATPPCSPMNIHSVFFNSANEHVSVAAGADPPPLNATPGPNRTVAFLGGFYTAPIGAARLAGPRAGDFRPTAGSPLISAGVALPAGYNITGPSSDIGAYQHDDPPWRPGCTFKPECA